MMSAGKQYEVELGRARRARKRDQRRKLLQPMPALAVGRAQMTQDGRIVLSAEQSASRTRDSDSCALLARRDTRRDSGSTSRSRSGSVDAISTNDRLTMQPQPLAAVCTRVSTADQANEDKVSRPGRADDCAALAGQQGFVVPDDLVFREMISGAADHRPVFEKMLAAAGPKFTRLFVWDQSRLSLAPACWRRSPSSRSLPRSACRDVGRRRRN